jgi:transcriptional regulator with XRE-family HTH domain
MTSQNGRAFNEWLRAQLKAKKMSQRQLAQQSGVDHSTISRLIRGDRMPSLGTATKLARGLRELREDADTPQYLGLVASGAANPTARVEYALRADELLNESHVRQVMEYYLAIRMRRFGRPLAANGGDDSTTTNSSRTSASTGQRAGDRPMSQSSSPEAVAAGVGGSGVTRLAAGRPGNRPGNRPPGRY